LDTNHDSYNVAQRYRVPNYLCHNQWINHLFWDTDTDHDAFAKPIRNEHVDCVGFIVREHFTIANGNPIDVGNGFSHLFIHSHENTNRQPQRVKDTHQKCVPNGFCDRSAHNDGFHDTVGILHAFMDEELHQHPVKNHLVFSVCDVDNVCVSVALRLSLMVADPNAHEIVFQNDVGNKRRNADVILHA
jgi:hypothetical protein